MKQKRDVRIYKMIDKQIIIDASKCEWRTGVEYQGNYECMLNKCCDYNCDWYRRRKLEQQLEAKEQECEEKQKIAQDAISKLCTKKSALYNELDQLKLENTKYKQTLDEIKEIAEYELNNLTDSAVHNGRYLEILQKISEYK